MPESNILCVICNRKRPRVSSVEAGMGRAGLVRTRVCRECARDPDSGVERRREAQEKQQQAAARRAAEAEG